MNVRRALPKIHFDQTLYRKANTCVRLLLYGSEVTGFENHDNLERLCLQFYKIILKAKKSTPNLMLYGELGRHPLSVSIKSRMIGFWQCMVNGKLSIFATKPYHRSHSMTKTNTMTFGPRKTGLGIRSVWSVFAVHMKNAWVLSFPLIPSHVRG